MEQRKNRAAQNIKESTDQNAVMKGLSLLKGNPAAAKAMTRTVQERGIEAGLPQQEIDQVKRDINNPAKLEMLENQAGSGKPESTSGAFTMALATFLPAIVGGLVGGEEGARGALGGALEGIKTGVGVASEIQKMDLDRKKALFGAAGNAPLGKQVFVNIDTGTPVQADLKSGKYRDLAGNIVPTEKVVVREAFKESGIQKRFEGRVQVKTDPITGELAAFDTRGNRVDIKDKTSAEDFLDNRLTVRQSKALTGERKVLNQNLDSHEKALSAANAVLAELQRPGAKKFTPAVIRSKMPRMFGEVGNLNEFEQKIWANSPEIVNAMETWYSTYADENATLTERDMAELKDIITNQGKLAERRVKELVDNSANAAAIEYEIPQEVFRKAVGTTPKLRSASDMRTKQQILNRLNELKSKAGK